MFACRPFTGAHLHHRRSISTKTLAILQKYQVFAYRLYYLTKFNTIFSRNWQNGRHWGTCHRKLLIRRENERTIIYEVYRHLCRRFGTRRAPTAKSN